MRLIHYWHPGKHGQTFCEAKGDQEGGTVFLTDFVRGKEPVNCKSCLETAKGYWMHKDICGLWSQEFRLRYCPVCGNDWKDHP